MGLFGLVRFQLGLLRISECKVFWVKTQKGAFFFLPGGIEFCGVLGVNGALKLFGLVRFQLGLLQIWEKVGGLSLSSSANWILLWFLMFWQLGLNGLGLINWVFLNKYFGKFWSLLLKIELGVYHFFFLC